MNNLKCEFCGHYNRPGAETCEECEFPVTGDGGAPAAGERYGHSGGGGAAPPHPLAEVPAPRFRVAGDVMAPTLGVYRKHFVLVGVLVAVTTLPVALLQYAAAQYAAPQSAAAGAVDVAEALRALDFSRWAAVLAGFLSFAGSALLSGALVHAVVEIQRTGAARAGESLRRGLLTLPKVLVVTLLYAIITGVGYVLLVVPGVIFSLMYSVAVPAAVAERLGPVAALKRSARLTDGYKGLIFLTTFLWGLVVVGLTLLVTGSFIAAGEADSLAPLLVQAVVVGMLNSSADVLGVYVFLGILGERRGGSETRAFAPGPEAAAPEAASA